MKIILTEKIRKKKNHSWVKFTIQETTQNIKNKLQVLEHNLEINSDLSYNQKKLILDFHTKETQKRLDKILYVLVENIIKSNNDNVIIENIPDIGCAKGIKIILFLTKLNFIIINNRMLDNDSIKTYQKKEGIWYRYYN